MNVSTYFRFLLGRRDAIEQVSCARGALDLGFLFALVAGIAREYDGHDLLHEPWHALVPILAWLVASLLLYGLVAIVARFRGLPVRWRRRSYRSLLIVCWLTTPMSWLLAVPVERFLSPAAALATNVTLAAVVVTWRVVLLSRCVAVLYRFRFAGAFWIVMLLLDLLAVASLHFAPEQARDWLFGLPAPGADQFAADGVHWVTAIGLLSLPVWLIGTLVLLSTVRRGDLPRAWTQPAPTPPRERVSRGLWSWAVVGLVMCGLILPVAQAEQIRAWRADRMLRAGQIEPALQYLSNYDRDDLPPHWDSAPRLGQGESTPNVLELAEQAHAEGIAPWVRRYFADKYSAYYRVPESPDASRSPARDLTLFSDEELDRHVRLLERMRRGNEVAETYEPQLAALLDVPTAAPLRLRRRDLLERLRSLGIRRPTEDTQASDITKGSP